MKRAIENWFLNIFLGKLLARGAVVLAGALAGPAVAPILEQVGIQITIDPETFAVGGAVLANSLFEYAKKRRMANPASPAIQTDANAPMAEIPALHIKKEREK